MFERETDLFDRVVERFIGSAEPAALSGNGSQLSGDLAPLALVFLDPSRAMSDAAARKGYTHRHCWGVLPSRKVPRWLLPLENPCGTIAGTEIYEPHARTSRIMKRALIPVIRTGWRGWARHKVLIASKEPLPLEVLVTDLTGETHPIFALSVGNQRVMRKLTVQVMRPNGEILGYMKLPLTAAATERVRHEAEILQRLWAFSPLRPHIPGVLYAGLCNDSYVLFQTPVVGEPGPTRLQRMHEQFLQTLWKVHREEKPGKMLVEEVARRWEKSPAQSETAWQQLGQEALRCSMQTLSAGTISCGVMHGDFAPWNTRVGQERLLLFDWELSAWEAPLSWDVFHFHVQTACFLKKNSGAGSFVQCTPGERASYLLYLLSSAEQLIAEGGDPAPINYRRTVLTKTVADEAVQKHAGSGKRKAAGQLGAAAIWGWPR